MTAVLTKAMAAAAAESLRAHEPGALPEPA